MNYANKSGIENAIDQVFTLFFNVAVGVSWFTVAYAFVTVISKAS